MADADDLMVSQMLARRFFSPDRRQGDRRLTPEADLERRRRCSYCYLPGDHSSPADCLKALERVKT